MSTTLWGGASANGVGVGNAVLGEVDGDGEDDVEDDIVLGFGDWRVDGVSVCMDGILVPVIVFWQSPQLRS